MTSAFHQLDIEFLALTITMTENSPSLTINKTSITELADDEIIIQVTHSSLNYKDELICAGNPGLVRRFPHIAGIDATGVVSVSHSPQFTAGDAVMVIATPLGVRCPGGLAGYIKVPVSWVMHVPKTMTVRDAAIFGTAGYTAALAVIKLEALGMVKDDGPVLITGASGGVGLIAAHILLARGYSVELISDNIGLQEMFTADQRFAILSREKFLKASSFPLLKAKYVGAIDCIGGNYLSISARSLKEGAGLCVIGMVASETTTLSLMPFILRGVQLIGISAETSAGETRQAVWKLIAEVMRLIPVETITRECTFAGALEHLVGNKRLGGIGRILVSIDG
jgi:acrylyl-CoA reductase (NADPH)